MKKSVKKVVIAVVSALAAVTVIGTSVAAANDFGKEKLNASVSRDDMYIFSNSDCNYLIGYSFEDTDTVKAVIFFENEEDIPDKAFKVHEDTACICHVDEVIYTAEEFERLREVPEDEFWSDGLNILQKAEKAYGNLAENQQANMINGDIVIVTWEYIPFSYDITVDLNK